MNDRLRSIPGWAGHEPLELKRRCLETELRHVRNVSGSLLREALEKWAEIWEEFQDQVTCGVTVLPKAQRGFKPRCGWPEFLEKMWQLKFYLDSAKRFCEQKR
jgi:peptide methionine sulfoxide reductase MsrB